MRFGVLRRYGQVKAVFRGTGRRNRGGIESDRGGPLGKRHMKRQRGGLRVSALLDKEAAVTVFPKEEEEQ